MRNRIQFFAETGQNSNGIDRIRPLHFMGVNLGKILTFSGALWLVIFAILLLFAQDRLYSIFWTPPEQLAGLFIGPLFVYVGSTLKKVF